MHLTVEAWHPVRDSTVALRIAPDSSSTEDETELFSNGENRHTDGEWGSAAPTQITVR